MYVHEYASSSALLSGFLKMKWKFFVRRICVFITPVVSTHCLIAVRKYSTSFNQLQWQFSSVWREKEENERLGKPERRREEGPDISVATSPSFWLLAPLSSGSLGVGVTLGRCPQIQGHAPLHPTCSSKVGGKRGVRLSLPLAGMFQKEFRSPWKQKAERKQINRSSIKILSLYSANNFPFVIKWNHLSITDQSAFIRESFGKLPYFSKLQPQFTHL